MLGILLFRGWTTDDGAVAAICYIAVSEFVPIAVPPLSVGVLVTGLLLGWGSSLGSAPSQMPFPPVVSILMLGTAAVLSVYKPWRRTPWTKGGAVGLAADVEGAIR